MIYAVNNMDFVRAVKKEFPKEKELREALDDPDGFHNDNMIGNFLKTAASEPINPTHIVRMLNRRNFVSLRHEAEKLVRRRQLYKWWLRIWTEAGPG